jgi:hypothetical protein
MAGLRRKKTAPRKDGFGACIRDRLESWKLNAGSTVEVIGIPYDIFSNSEVVHFPSNLSSRERHEVHSAAASLDLFHCSVGDGSDRHVVVSRAAFALPEQQPSSSVKQVAKPYCPHRALSMSDLDYMSAVEHASLPFHPSHPAVVAYLQDVSQSPQNEDLSHLNDAACSSPCVFVDTEDGLHGFDCIMFACHY